MGRGNGLGLLTRKPTREVSGFFVGERCFLNIRFRRFERNAEAVKE